AALLAFAALLRMLSVALALLQNWGFRLEEHGRRVTVERGLLTRLRTSAPRRRIQSWTLSEGGLHRWFGRRRQEVESAVAGDGNSRRRGLRELAPIAPPAACDELVRHLLPGAAWPPARWHSLHPRAWWRLSLPGALFACVLAAALCWRFGPWGLAGLLWLPWAVFVARQHARRAGYAVEGQLVGARGGWWSRHWRFAEIDKLQVLEVRQSPLDRWLGMA